MYILISVGYHSELHVAIAFYQLHYIIFLVCILTTPNMIISVIWYFKSL